jgi:ABC-type sugar transport system substrate-binding protein
MRFTASFLTALLASTAIAAPVTDVDQADHAQDAKRQIGVVPPPGVSTPCNFICLAVVPSFFG